MPRQSKKTINLALQGGGAHGALAWGILDKLLEDGRLKFDSVTASSAGAMNAMVLAHGLAVGGYDGARESLAQFWKKISNAGQLYNPVKESPIESMMGVGIEHSVAYFMTEMVSRMLSPYQFNPTNFNPLREVLEACIDIDLIKQSDALNVFLSATNVKTCKIKVFDKSELSYDAVLASACLPCIFQAVNIGDDYYWDGGYMGNPALFPLIYNSKCKDILILHINPIYRETVPESVDEIMNRVNEISFNSSLMREMRAIAFVSNLLDNDWIKKEHRHKMKRLYLHAIRADKTMQSFSVASKMGSDWDFIMNLFEIGREQADIWLRDNLTCVGKKSSIDINEYL